jgi:MYXO-CTERM domain-containing protein
VPLPSPALAAGLALALLLTAPAAGQVLTEPPAGSFQLRPELIGRHPRLYFTSEAIPELRRQGLGPRRFFLDRAKAAFGSYRGRPAELLHNWKDYLYGFWGQFTMNMLHLVEQDQVAADTARSWALFFARNQGEWLADDLVPMEITTGLALSYDILFDQFSEAERAELRAALFASAEFIRPRFFVGDYWTQDLQNNHMHNRIHGLAHAAFAIYGDDPALDVQPHADLAVAAFQEVARWLPDDGSTHEGPGYWSYGRHWVVRTGHLMEHLTGNDPTAATPGFQLDPYYRLYLTTPGFRQTFGIGDAGDGAPSNVECMARAFARERDGHGQAALGELMRLAPEGFYQHAAWGLLWYDGELEALPLGELPLWRHWPDLEMFSIRSAWEPEATALVWKCGPPGGHRMQQLGAGAWFNVAHDHPDQNHFLLYAHGKLLAEDDGYPKEKKLTRSHNTVLFDGQGGPREDTGWYQPFPYEQTATTTDLFLSQATAFATGDATRLYAARSPAASRIVRHLAFLEGEYLMIVDELAGGDGAEHDFEWRLHKQGDWTPGAPGQFFVSAEDVRLDIRFLAPSGAALTSAFLPAELTAPPCLAVRTRGPAANFLSVLVPQRAQAPVIAADLPPATNALAVRGTQGTRVDLFGVAQGPGGFTLADAEAHGRAAVIRRDGGALRLSLLVRGTSLRQADRLLLEASQPANLAFRPSPAGGALEAEAPHKTTGGLTEIRVGGLVAGHAYQVRVDGQAVADVRADAAGVASLSLDLSARRSVAFTDNGAVEADGDGGPEDGGGDAGPGDDGADGAGGSDTGADPGTPGKVVGSCGCGSTADPSGPLLLALGFGLFVRRRARVRRRL